MDRELDFKPEVVGSNPVSGRKSTTAPRALHSPVQVCTLGWVKCREHISLLIILCIIVYVTNKAHPSLICCCCCRVERHRIQAAWSPVWSFQNPWRFEGAITSAGVDPLCFIKSKVNAAVYQDILEDFMLPSADKLYEDADFLFQQDFSTCTQCQKYFQVICWPWYYCEF